MLTQSSPRAKTLLTPLPPPPASPWLPPASPLPPPSTCWLKHPIEFRLITPWLSIFVSLSKHPSLPPGSSPSPSLLWRHSFIPLSFHFHSTFIPLSFHFRSFWRPLILSPGCFQGCWRWCSRFWLDSWDASLHPPFTLLLPHSNRKRRRREMEGNGGKWKFLLNDPISTHSLFNAAELETDPFN